MTSSPSTQSVQNDHICAVINLSTIYSRNHIPSSTSLNPDSPSDPPAPLLNRGLVFAAPSSSNKQQQRSPQSKRPHHRTAKQKTYTPHSALRAVHDECATMTARNHRWTARRHAEDDRASVRFGLEGMEKRNAERLLEGRVEKRNKTMIGMIKKKSEGGDCAVEESEYEGSDEMEAGIEEGDEDVVDSEDEDEDYENGDVEDMIDDDKEPTLGARQFMHQTISQFKHNAPAQRVLELDEDESGHHIKKAVSGGNKIEEVLEDVVEDFGSRRQSVELLEQTKMVSSHGAGTCPFGVFCDCRSKRRCSSHVAE